MRVGFAAALKLPGRATDATNRGRARDAVRRPDSAAGRVPRGQVAVRPGSF